MTNIILMLPIIVFFAYATIMFLINKFIFSLHTGLLLVLTIGNFIVSLNNGGSLLMLILQTVFALIFFVLMVFMFSKKASGETMLAFTAIVALAPISKNFNLGISGIILTFVLFLIYAAIFYKKEFSQATASVNKLVSNGNNQDDVNVTPDAFAKNVTLVDAEDSEIQKDDLVTDDNNIALTTNNATKESQEVNNDEQDFETQNIPRTLKGDIAIALLSTYDGQLKLPNYDYLPDRKTIEKEKRISFSIFVLISYALVALSNFAYVTYFIES